MSSRPSSSTVLLHRRLRLLPVGDVGLDDQRAPLRRPDLLRPAPRSGHGAGPPGRRPPRARRGAARWPRRCRSTRRSPAPSYLSGVRCQPCPGTYPLRRCLRSGPRLPMSHLFAAFAMMSGPTHERYVDAAGAVRRGRRVPRRDADVLHDPGPAGDPRRRRRAPRADQGPDRQGQRVLNEHGLAVPALARRVGRPRLVAAAPAHLARGDAARLRPAAARLQRLHGRPGDRGVRLAGAEGAVPRRRPRTSTSGGARASPSRTPAPTSPRCAPPRSATATSTSSTARRPGRRSASTATGSSAWSAPTPT